MGNGNAGRFAHGNRGRPLGSKNRATRLLENLDKDEAKELVRRAFRDALKKDGPTRRVFLERFLPKDRTIEIDLPVLTDAHSAITVLGAIVREVASGALTPAEGSSMSALVSGYARAHEVAELESRIAELERRAENK